MLANDHPLHQNRIPKKPGSLNGAAAPVRGEGEALHDPRGLCCLVLVLFSANQPSGPLAGFVKSQEGENEEGKEGELVVKFSETLPKVIQEQDVSRENFALTSGWQSSNRVWLDKWGTCGMNAREAVSDLLTLGTSSLSRCFKAHLAAVVKHEPMPRGPNIPKWISVPLVDYGSDLAIALSDRVSLQRRKLRQIPERFVHSNLVAVRAPGPVPQSRASPAVHLPLSSPGSEGQWKEQRGVPGSHLNTKSRKNPTCPWPHTSRG